MSEYREIATIRGDQDVSVRITTRKDAKGVLQYSFAFLRSFPKHGETKETHWFGQRHLDAIAALIPLVEERLRKEMRG